MDTIYTNVLSIAAGNFVKISDRVYLVISAIHDTTSSHSKLWYSQLRMRDMLSDSEITREMYSKTGFIDRVNLIPRLYRTSFYPTETNHRYCLLMENDESFLELVIDNIRKKYDILLTGLRNRATFDVEVVCLEGSDRIISYTRV